MSQFQFGNFENRGGGVSIFQKCPNFNLGILKTRLLDVTPKSLGVGSQGQNIDPGTWESASGWKFVSSKLRSIISMSVSLSVSLSVCWSACLLVYLFVGLPVCPSTVCKTLNFREILQNIKKHCCGDRVFQIQKYGYCQAQPKPQLKRG